MPQQLARHAPRRDDRRARHSTDAKDALLGMILAPGIERCDAAADADGPSIGEGGAMAKEPAVEGGATATYTVLNLPLMLGSLPLTMLPLLLPLYAKQFGATALGIGGLFAVAQGMMVLCRPVIGWGVDRWGRRGFCLVGLGCAAGAMGMCALAGTLTTLYLAQLLNGLATACTWTAVYTLTSDLAPAATHGEALGRVDEYAHRGGLYGMGFALALLSWWALETALRMLFLSYMVLAVIAVVMAWTQVPETRTGLPPSRGASPGRSGPWSPCSCWSCSVIF